MTENQIKVNNWPEILAKIKELVSQDKNWKLAENYYLALSTNEEKKPCQGVKIKKEGEIVDIYCEAKSPFDTSTENELDMGNTPTI